MRLPGYLRIPRLPLLGKELIELGSRPRTYVIRTIYAFLLFGSFALLFHQTTRYMHHLPASAVLGMGVEMFGGVMAFQLRLQAMGANLPSSLLLMLPYVLTVVVLVLSMRQNKTGDAPAALGVNTEPRE